MIQRNGQVVPGRVETQQRDEQENTKNACFLTVRFFSNVTFVAQGSSHLQPAKNTETEASPARFSTPGVVLASDVLLQTDKGIDRTSWVEMWVEMWGHFGMDCVPTALLICLTLMAQVVAV